MKHPRTMSQADLVAVVEQLQSILYFDHVAERWDADKEHDSDTLAAVDGLLADFGLKPEN